MMNMMDNATLAKEFPMIAEMKNKSGEGPPSPRFIQMLEGCRFEGLLALMCKIEIKIYLKKVVKSIF